MQQRHIFSALLAGTALTLATQAVAAQDAVTDKPDAQEGTTDSEGTEGNVTPNQHGSIVVTGSRIRGAAVAGEVITLDQEAIVAAGHVDLGEAIRSLPQNFNGGQNPGIGTGAGLINSNVNSASSANLRGLGPDATLTLLNGHRLPYDSAFGGVDISAIPLAALDRIEVLPDGASALYGSDAVAGVVNVILRRDFEGVATSAQIGASSDGGYFRQQADIVGGTTWNSGGFLVAYDFSRNSEIESRQRSYAGSLDPDSFLYPSQHRHAATFSAHQSLGDRLVAKIDVLFSRRESETVGGTPASRFLFSPKVESLTVAPSLELQLGPNWEAKIVGVLGRDHTNYQTSSTPLGGSTTITSGCFCNSVASLDISAEGPLFELAGGSARMAIGGGIRGNGMDFTRLINGAPSAAFDVTRRSRYLYGEIYLPFVSTELEIRGIDRLGLSGALRYEDYKGLDRLATPRIGLIYAPVSTLTLRGSFARSFKAPSLYQQYVPFQAFLLPGAAFGAGVGTVFYTSGGNPDLESERASSWTAGFEFKPKMLPGFTAGATYFDISYRDRVVQPIAGSIAAAFSDPGYATLINRWPGEALLEELVAGAQFGVQNFSGAPYDPANVIALVDNRNINVAVQKIRGVDAHLAWSGDVGAGKLGVDLAGTWLESRQQLTSDLPQVELAGTIFNPPKLRARAAVNYRINGFKLSSSLNYTGALQDQRFAAEARIAPSATLDMGASYDVIAGEGAEPALSFSITINNIFNDKPDLIRTTGPTDTPYDSTNFSPIGRFLAVGIRRSW